VRFQALRAILRAISGHFAQIFVRFQATSRNSSCDFRHFAQLFMRFQALRATLRVTPGDFAQLFERLRATSRNSSSDSGRLRATLRAISGTSRNSSCDFRSLRANLRAISGDFAQTFERLRATSHKPSSVETSSNCTLPPKTKTHTQ